MATASCSIRTGAPTTWRLAKESAPYLTARQTRMHTIKWRSFRKSGQSRFHLTKNESGSKIFTRRSAKSARAKPVTNGLEKSGRPNRLNIRAIGYCRWKSLKFSTLRISSRVESEDWDVPQREKSDDKGSFDADWL